MGVRHFELRTYNTDRVPLFSDFQKARIQELLDAYQAKVVAISPGIFKCPFPTGPRDHFPLHAFDRALYANWKAARDVVDGDIDWENQIRALAADGYDGFISLETHMEPKLQSARVVLDRLRALIGQ